MAQNKTDYLENAIINAVLRNVPFVSPAAVFVALFTTAPGEVGGGSEVSTAGTGYIRQAVAFSAPVNGLTSNSVDVVYAVALAPWGTVTHFAVFDAVSGGNLLYYGTLTTPRTINLGDQGRWSAGALQVMEL